ncbi:MAG TPA: hypothetical protein VGH15_08610 [Caulobacteraceae bacterium]
MAETLVAAGAAVERRARVGGVARLRFLWPVGLFILASLAAIASDLTTPLGASIDLVGAGIIAAMAMLGVLYLRSIDSGHEASFLALALPAALCAFAVFQQREGPQGQPHSGVIATAFPAVERQQAARLAVSADAKAALAIEADLKAGDASTKADAIRRIAEQPLRAGREYLYETAVRFGDLTQRQLVAATLLRGLAGRSLPMEVQGEDNFTIYQQYLEGSSIRFDSSARRLRARLRTNKEIVVMSGELSGPTLTMSGGASVADRRFPLTINATMGPDLAFLGTVHFAQGADAAFVIHPF